MTENETKIVESCLNIVNNNKNVTIEDPGNVKMYTVYCDKKRVFRVDRNFIHSVDNWEYKLDIDNNIWKFCGDRHDLPALDTLYEICAKKYIEQTQKREYRALNFLAQFNAREK